MKKYLIVLGLAVGSAQAEQVTDEIAPESASGLTNKTEVTATEFMIATANPYATDAGFAVLENGGHAIDAMVAAQTMLGLTEPQSSGLGGGGFVIYYDAKTGKLTTFDGRETAPQAATSELFLDDNGEPLAFFSAVVGGRSVGTPGTVKLMASLHQRYGNQTWENLLAPAITQAEGGFVVSPRLAGAIEADVERLHHYPDTREYFFDAQGEPLQAGDVLKNPAYAATLSQLAKEGEAAFYQGEIGAAIIDAVQGASDNPGLLSLSDLADYEVIERPAVCAPYRQYDVCGMGPPSSGALTIGQILGVLQYFDLKTMGADSPLAWQLIGDASRLAFADRGRYMADSDFVDVPVAGLVDPSYLQQRAALLAMGKALTDVAAGTPPNAPTQATHEAIELPSTTHLVIVDRQGNIVSMTSSIENGFGSRVMAGGFLLNNQLTDFAFVPDKDGVPVANRIEAGKRPRSSMAPTIVLEEGKPVLAIGSPGGSRIIGYVTQAIINYVDWGMSLQDALNAPHAVNRFGTYDIEKGSDAEALAKPLQEMGFLINIRDLNSGLQAIAIGPEGLLSGAADPRREGTVMGK
uniref:gamma-glutamyltransferase n=1 Tax=Thaumasiovibrio occultus TaxID=1891184 RepID=UPI000B358A59|nr:gamma-glutamyltransferase [Thaumasiovibrio occultus]